ncbi:MAG: TlpA family protein disulfide reductase [Phycisphaerae bacterium]|nr:TlpA family protein disulfide reductase [Phycisphaerae bacterium]
MRWICVVLAGGVLLTCGCERRGAARQVAVDFTLKDLSGKDVSLSAFKGQPVLLSFWAVQCGACRVEAPHLSALQKKYGGRGLIVLAINAWNEPRAEVARYVRSNQLKHRILLDGAEVGSKGYGIRSLPTCFWIDRTGMIVHRLSGFSRHDLKRMEQWTEEILSQ